MSFLQRQLLFRDFLPFTSNFQKTTSNTIENTGYSSPRPLISPFLQDERDKVKVLRSVFLPSKCNTLTADGEENQHYDQTSKDKFGANVGSAFVRHPMPRNLSNQDSKPPRNTTPRNDSQEKMQQTTTSQQRKVFFNFGNDPIFDSDKVQSHSKHTPKQYRLVSPSGILFLPNGSTIDLPGGPHSGKSLSQGNRTPETEKSLTSYTDVPITMLSVPNIQTCDSKDELQTIIDVLESQKEYPALLRFAKRRLMETSSRFQSLQKKCDEYTFHLKNNTECIVPKATEHILTVKSIKPPDADMMINDNSLVMSLSSDEEDSLLMASIGSSNVHGDKDTDLSKKMKVPNLSGSSMERSLYGDIQKLKRTITALENARSKEKAEYEEKLQHIQQSYQSATLQIELLENMTSMDKSEEAKPETKLLIRQLELLKQEKKAFYQNFIEERSLRIQKEREMYLLEQRLKKEINDLKDEIQNHHYLQGRNAFSPENGKHRELSELLCSVQAKLEEIKNERDAMIVCLVEIVEHRQIEMKDVDRLSEQERSQLLLESRKTMQQNSQALEALKRALLESGEKLVAETKTREDQEIALTNAQNDMENIRNENIKLSRSIEGLNAELRETRHYFEDLVESIQNQHMNQMEQRERYYQAMISSMKTKLNENRQAGLGSEKSTKQVPLTSIGNQTAQLSKRLLAHGIKPALRVSPSRIKGILSQEKDKTAFAIAHNNVPSLISGAQHSLSHSHRDALGEVERNKENQLQLDAQCYRTVPMAQKVVPESDSFVQRRTLVRAAGGRKGLTEKLKKIRSPYANSTCNTYSKEGRGKKLIQ